MFSTTVAVSLTADGPSSRMFILIDAVSVSPSESVAVIPKLIAMVSL